MLTGTITNVPHVARWQALLDSGAMIRNPVAVFERYRAGLGATFSFHFGGTRPTIVSSDPDFIQHVLRDKRDNYQKSEIQVERMVEFQGEGLVNSHGDDWLRRRRLLARGFLPGRLSNQLPGQQGLLHGLMEGLDLASRQGSLDIRPHMVRFTLRLVGNSLFGRSMSDNELAQIATAISEIQSFIVRQIVRPYMIPWYRITGLSRHHQRIRVEADRIVLRHIEARRRESTAESDLLRLMLDAPFQASGEPMSEDQVKIESLQLMVAGNETSSNALTWIFYLLGRHPQYIASIRREITSVIGNSPIRFEKLHELSLTLRIINEALRLYPPFWMIDRTARADDTIGGIRIPAGTMVVPYIFGAHHDASIWPDPEAFDPERFSTERSGGRHRFAYLPFGGGPRLCIGNNMAITQILLIIVAVVQKYDFAMADDKPVNMRPMMLLRPDGPVRMRFRAVQE
jgi:cytochrome P450